MFESTRLSAATVVIVALSLAQLACGGAGGESAPGVTNPPPTPASNTPTTGTLVVALQPRGNGRDADGFSVTLDGASPNALTYDASALTYSSLSPGDHTVRITGIAPQCSAAADSITNTTKAGVTDTVVVGMTCLGGFAYVQVVDSITTDIAYLTEDGRTIQLTSGPDNKLIGPWSPDGTRLLYTQHENGNFHLHSVRADGTSAVALTSGSGNESAPRWSPDGAHIAYQKSDSAGVYIVISDPDGGNAHALAGASQFDFDLTWSRDGSRLYFGCDRFGRSHDLCTAALDGSDLRAIRYAALEPTVTPCSPICMGLLEDFTTSPDGTTIAFDELPASGTAPLPRVWAASLDGTSAIPLSGNTFSFHGQWAPSGDRILLDVSSDLVSYALATVNKDGSSYRQIVSYADFIGGGAWSPDGSVIAYTDLKAGQVGVMNADGSNRRLLTAGRSAYEPVWNPKVRTVGTLNGDLIRASSPRLQQASRCSIQCVRALYSSLQSVRH